MPSYHLPSFDQDVGFETNVVILPWTVLESAPSANLTEAIHIEMMQIERHMKHR